MNSKALKRLSDLFRLPAARILSGIVLSAAAVYLVSRENSFKDLPGSLAGVQVSWLFFGLIITFSGHVFKALRWRILLQAENTVVTFGVLLRYVLIGQLTNLFVPGRAGDLGRAWLVGARGGGRAFSLGTVVIEKLLDLVFYGLLAAGLVFSIPLPGEVSLSPPVLAAIAGAAAAGLLVGVRYWERLTGLALPLLRVLGRDRSDRAAGWLNSAGSSLNAFRNTGKTAGIVFSTAGIWVISWLTNEIVLRAFGLVLPVSASLMLLIVLQAGISTNLVPGTIGLFEYLCVISLALFGVPREIALAYGVVLHALVLLPLIGGGLSVFFGKPELLENRA